MPTPAHAPSRPAWLAAPLALSSAAFLIYVAAWFQALQLHAQSSTQALTFFALALLGGWAVGGALARPRSQRAIATGLIVLGGLCIALSMAMPLAGKIAGIVPAGFALILAALFVLPPAMLFGILWASLPSTHATGSLVPGIQLSAAGASCIAAAFWLFPRFDLTWLAAAASLVQIALGIALLARASAQSPAAAEDSSPSLRTPLVQKILMRAALFMGGVATAGALVLWLRQIPLLMGESTFLFWIIISVFISAAGAGALIGAIASRTLQHPRLALAWCLALLAVGVAWSLYALSTAIPAWPVSASVALSTGYRAQLDFTRTLWAILPAALFAGALLPLAQFSAARPRRTFPTLAFDILLGILFFSLFALRTWGSQGSGRIVIALAGVGGICAALAAAAEALSAYTAALKEPEPRPSRKPALAHYLQTLTNTFLVLLAAAGALTAVVYKGVDQLPWTVVAFGADASENRAKSAYRTLLGLREGTEATAAVTKDWSGNTYLHTSAMRESSSAREDLRLQALLSHFPAMLHPAPRKILVAGSGTGIVAGAFTLYLPPRNPSNPDDVQLVICEPEPIIATIAATHFHSLNNEVLTRKENGELLDPRVRLFTGTARSRARSANDTFDIITTTPVHPAVHSAAPHLTVEYYELLKSRLAPGGIVVQWVPLFDTSIPAIQSQIKTFATVFPSTTLWGSERSRARCELVLLGTVEPARIDVAALHARADSLLTRSVLANSGVEGSMDLLRTYAGSAADLQPWLAAAELTRDAHLRARYLAAPSGGTKRPSDILSEIQTYRTFPQFFLNLSPEQQTSLEQQWAPQSRLINAPESR